MTELETPTDHELVLRYHGRGDMEAFSALLWRHEAALLRLARGLLGNEEAAQDAVQEVFIRCAKHAGRLAEDIHKRQKAGTEGVGSIRAWLCTVLRNHCIDRSRKAKVRSVVPVEAAETASVGGGGSSDPDNPEVSAGDRDTGRLLWDHVAALPPLERAAVLLRYRHDCSYGDIAEQLGKSVNHVGVLLHQALKRLREAASLRQEVLL